MDAFSERGARYILQIFRQNNVPANAYMASDVVKEHFAKTGAKMNEFPAALTLAGQRGWIVNNGKRYTLTAVGAKALMSN